MRSFFLTLFLFTGLPAFYASEHRAAGNIFSCVTGSSDHPALSGSWNFILTSDHKIITVAGQVSNDQTVTTGTLNLKLYLTDTPFTGGAVSGQVIFTHDCKSLAAGDHQDIQTSQNVLIAVPAGTFYPTLVLLENSGAGEKIVDYINFDKMELSIPVSELMLTRDWSIDYVNGEEKPVLLNGGAVLMNSSVDTSGVLKLSVMLSAAPDEEAGTILTEVSLDPLMPRGRYNFGTKSIGSLIKEIAPGRYYVTLILSEYHTGMKQFYEKGKRALNQMLVFSANGKVTTEKIVAKNTLGLGGSWNVTYMPSDTTPLHIEGGSIINNAPNSSDALKLSIVLSTDPYNGDNGILFASQEYSRILHNGKADVSISLIPSATIQHGTYFVTLVLYDYFSGSYTLVADKMTLNQKITL
jgi:hypothetical protein